MEPSSVLHAVEGVSCPVCLEVFDASFDDTQARMLTCGHTFCHRCCCSLILQCFQVDAEVKGSVKCPSCRALIPTSGASAIPRNFAVEACAVFITRMLQACTCTQRQVPCTVERQGDAPIAPNASDAGELQSEPRKEFDAFPASPLIRLRAAGAPAHEVFAAVMQAVSAANRPVPINRICQILEEKRLWPPSGLAELLAAKDQTSGRSGITATSLSATVLARPSPALVKAFILSRLPREEEARTSGSGNRGGQRLHVEISTRTIAECLCLGGAACRKSAAAAPQAAYQAPMRHEFHMPHGLAMSSGRQGRAGDDRYNDDSDGEDYSAYEDAVLRGRKQKN